MAGFGTASGLATNLLAMNAFADSSPDYRALVCIFLYGGMDCHDTIIPHDPVLRRPYEAVREPLLKAYDRSNSRRSDNLLQLSGSLRQKEFSLPPEFSNLHRMFNAGQMAVVANVGTLIEPLTATSFKNRSRRLPPKLFSHNDQQSVWMSSGAEGTSMGWSGRFADIAVEAGNNVNASFTAISTSGSALLLTGKNTRPFVVSPSGALSMNRMGGKSTFGKVYEDVLRDAGESRSNLFQKDIISLANSTLDNNSLLNELLELPGDPQTNFPNSSLGDQLRMVARIISRRNNLGVKRQVFFVSAKGFDTHSDQAAKLQKIQLDLDESIGAFYAALSELNVQNSVTSFTASDFGRTLAINNDGSDHGWGGHHFVIGGMVNGGNIIGEIPPPELNHEADSGGGRLIPQISVEQYAAALGRWFGLSQSEIREILPSLKNFDISPLEGLFH